MQGLSSYVVTLSSTFRLQAHTAEDAVTAAWEIMRRDGPEELDVQRSEDEPSDRELT